MHKFVKKVYISVLAITLVGITFLTTTYAWVGIYANSTFDNFELILQSQDLTDYGIELSLTGEEGTFSTSLSDIEIKKQILKNMGYSGEVLQSIDSIESIFNRIKLDQATVKRNEDGSLGQFYTFNASYDKGNIASIETNKYFKFDIYISAKKMFDSATIDSTYFLNIYLQGDLFSSKKSYSSVVNSFTYPGGYVSLEKNGIEDGSTISDKVSVKPEYACRVAIEKYKAVSKYDINASQTFDSAIIYEGGSHEPMYDLKQNIYSFGGILPDSTNLALNDWNYMNPSLKKTVPLWAVDRGDIEYDYNDLNQIITKDDKVGVNSMMKLTIYFWYEGWDADCFSVIDSNPVSLNFNFSTKVDEETD